MLTTFVAWKDLMGSCAQIARAECGNKIRIEVQFANNFVHHRYLQLLLHKPLLGGKMSN